MIDKEILHRSDCTCKECVTAHVARALFEKAQGSGIESKPLTVDEQ